MQIVRQFKLLVLQGVLRDGDEMPSRRMLAVHMGVNPMTVQKAFNELEGLGLVYTPPKSKCFVRVNEGILRVLRGELLEGQVNALVTTAVDAGVGCDEMIEMIKAVYAWAEGFGKNR